MIPPVQPVFFKGSAKWQQIEELATACDEFEAFVEGLCQEEPPAEPERREELQELRFHLSLSSPIECLLCVYIR